MKRDDFLALVVGAGAATVSGVLIGLLYDPSAPASAPAPLPAVSGPAGPPGLSGQPVHSVEVFRGPDAATGRVTCVLVGETYTCTEP